MQQGWIKLHRQIMENEFYFSERFTRSQAWVDLLLLANHKPNTVFIRGNEVNTNIGELCFSELTLAKRWNWNRKTVDKFLGMLKNKEMLDIRKTRLTTIISIKKWNLYQGDGQQSIQQNGQQKDNRTDTNKNDKNVENDYSVYTDIFSYWNSKAIIQHKKLDDKIKSKIKALLKDYTPEEIKTSIENYSLILSNPQQFYFNYKWNLKDFFSRGFEKFIDLETAKNNYRNKQSYFDQLNQQTKNENQPWRKVNEQ